MFRSLLTLLLLVLGAVSLIGCAGEMAAGSAAKSPQAVRRSEFRGGVPAEPAAKADTLASGSFEEDASEGGDFTPSSTSSSVDAKEIPLPKVVAANATAQNNAPAQQTKATGPSFVSGNPHVPDLIIYTATVTMAVYQVEPGLDAVEKIARELNGYLAQRGDKQITVRVPRAKFDEALRRVQASGDVIHRDVNAEDVTDQYVELETRLKNARAMRDRLEQLLARAAVKEAVEIEKELGRVTGDIEAMEGKLKVLRDKIAYSTITVSFEPRGGSAVRDVPLRLPFGWLGGLGLPRLLSLGEGQ